MRLPENNGDFEYLQDEIVSLAEDIIELDDKVDTIDNQQLSILQIVTQMTGIVSSSVDIIADEAELIKDLDKKFELHDGVILILFIVFLIWNLILSYNVFF